MYVLYCNVIGPFAGGKYLDPARACAHAPNQGHGDRPTDLFVHCDERAMPFVAIWYTLGVVIRGLAGAFMGRLILRWRLYFASERCSHFARFCRW
ncbi:NrsF family protein [Phyllobacterium trifolii]|uniref:NrsF family protein n=1 Tax=Phyllobacterium trifolii TaxID=300193 RepID=UPI0035E410A5